MATAVTTAAITIRTTQVATLYHAICQLCAVKWAVGIGCGIEYLDGARYWPDESTISACGTADDGLVVVEREACCGFLAAESRRKAIATATTGVKA